MKDLVFDFKKNLGIGTTEPNHQIAIECKCGNKSYVDTNFEINIIGMIQFKCKECGKISDAPYIYWKE